ncbi:HipA domain-containing protein [Arthrobacter sp. LS16]|uniref:HipA domain-containing protein n=1 Tax=Arthrobacter sp. 'calajunan' TaxID=1690248 RepID=UPI003C7660A2
MLSVRLPVRQEPYPTVATDIFLAGLLPEDPIRTSLANSARVAPGDIYGMLRAYGRECAGATQVLDSSDSQLSGQDVLWRTPDELPIDLAELPTAPLGTSIDRRVRVSLGGVQGKLLVVKDGDRIGVPIDGRPSTHILKPARLKEDGSELWPGIAQLETFALKLLNHTQLIANGVEAAEAEVLDIQGRKAILVRRYDREVAPDTGVVRRIHQEDFCQVLGITAKYQQVAHGSPNLVQVAEALKTHASKPLPEIIKLLKMLACNMAIGNCDMHARNISLLLQRNGVSLAPAYDVVPTAVWPDLDRELSLRIGGEAFLDDLTADHLLAEAMSWGLRSAAASRQVRIVLDALASAIPLVTHQAQDEGWWHPLFNEATKGLHRRIEMLTPA